MLLQDCSAVVNVRCISELFAPRFCKLPCGGIGVDMDTVWCDDDTVLAARLVRSDQHSTVIAVSGFALLE